MTNVIVDFFSNSKYAKKHDFLSEKRESGMTLKKLEFTPESGSVDTYVDHISILILFLFLLSHQQGSKFRWSCGPSLPFETSVGPPDSARWLSSGLLENSTLKNSILTICSPGHINFVMPSYFVH